MDDHDPSGWMPSDPDDWRVEAELVRSRRRRTLAAQVMVAILVVPLAVQGLLVSLGAAARWGLIVVALPAAVVWILLQGRRG